MKLAIRILSLCVFAALPVALFAQWPAYPSKNVPKLADGKPNLQGPAPRTADGKPDLSGLWEFVDANPRRPRPAPASTATPPAVTPAPPAGTDAKGSTPLVPGNFGPSQFFNIGSTLKDGLPFTPWAAALRKERVTNNAKDNPDAHCLPMGLLQFHTHPQPRKIVQTPDLIVIMYEANYGLRQIFMDGRPLPNPKDVDPWWYGYSVGHWDGDTLVVETTGFRDDVWLDVEGSPLTNSGKMIERYRRPDFGHLEIEVTVEDPKAYTHPWTIKINQRIMLDSNLIEFICDENEQSDAHLVGNGK
jgi:hypothetical protein